MRKSMVLMVLMIVVISAFWGCASAPEKPQIKDKSVRVWPAPPDTPRVQYVASYRFKEEVEPSSGMLRFLGEDEIKALQRPHGIVTDRDGNIYVSDSTLFKLFVFDFKKGKFRTLGGKGIPRLEVPLGLAIDNERGLVFATDIKNRMVFAIDKDSDTIEFTIGQQPGTFERPISVAVDPVRQVIYVSDSKLHMVKAFDYQTNYLYSIGKGHRSEEDDGFNVPSHLVLDSNGNLYVADMFNRYIKVFDTEGKFVRKIGSGVGIGFGFFSKVTAVALDSEEHIYGLDTDLCNFQIFDQDNTLLLAVGEPGGTIGRFLIPTHIFIDEEDRIYVTDTQNSRIQVFQYLGKKWEEKQAK